MALTLGEVATFLETAGEAALTAAGLPEVAAFLPIADKFVRMVAAAAERESLIWNPAIQVQATELGALAALDTLKDDV